MISQEQNGLVFLQFPSLAVCKNVWHGVFTRSGGCSPPPYNSLNISFGVGDHRENVFYNRDKILNCCGAGELIFTNQLHGVKVLTLSKDHSSEMRAEKETMLEGDALITNIRGKALVIKTADCQSVMLIDPVQNVIANVHSGWRGSVQNIIAKTIDTMAAKFNCRAEDLRAGVGPSLGPCCGEFIHYQKEIPEAFWEYRVSEVRFDFWAISQEQLRQAGVRSEHIHISRICTKCNTNRFFSYRGEGQTGGFASVIILK